MRSLRLAVLAVFCTGLAYAQVQETPVVIDRLEAKQSLELPGFATPPAADCDNDAEFGRMARDTDDGVTGAVWICGGKAAGWIPFGLVRRVTSPDRNALPGFMEFILPTTGENDCEGRVALRLFGRTECLATTADFAGGGLGAHQHSAADVTAGTLAVARGGTNLAAAADDQIMLGNATTWESKAVPDCNTENMLTYTASTNTFGCEADSTGAGGGDPVLIDGVAVADAAGVDLQGGAGVAITFNAGASPDTASFATASGETGFLASGALTCGAGTAGKAQVHTTALQYCDNAATPTLRYSAYGESDGDAVNAVEVTCTGCVANTELSTDYSGVGTCTNQFVRVLNDGAAPTCATVDMSADTNLTGGRSTTMNADALDADVETYEHTKCMVIETPADADNFLFYRVERAATVTGIDCLSNAATSTVITVQECNANGGACAATEAAITCAVTNTTEAAGIDDAVWDAGDWIRVDVGVVTGTPGHVAVCVSFTNDD